MRVAGALAERDDDLFARIVGAVIGADFLRERSRGLYSQNAGH